MREEQKRSRTTQKRQTRISKPEKWQCKCQKWNDTNTHFTRRTNPNRTHNLACNFSENNTTVDETLPYQITFDDCITCEYYHAIKLPAERSRIYCSNYKVKLTELNISLPLQRLLHDQDRESKNFQDKIRIYNSIFSFISIGVKLDHELVNAKKEIYTFRVQGPFYHQIGSLLPEPGSDSQYLQMYTWDTNHETNHWLNAIAIPDSNINPTIIVFKRDTWCKQSLCRSFTTYFRNTLSTYYKTIIGRSYWYSWIRSEN